MPLLIFHTITCGVCGRQFKSRNEKLCDKLLELHNEKNHKKKLDGCCEYSVNESYIDTNKRTCPIKHTISKIF